MIKGSCLNRLILSAILALLTWPSAAQDSADPLADVPSPDEVRFISADDSTSKCIGNPQTPLCAVETVLACFSRMEINLCRRAGVTVDLYLGERPRTARYRVLETRILTEDDMTEELNDANWWKPGFVYFLLSEFFNIKDGTTIIKEYRYIAKRTEQDWEVISWTVMEEQDPDDPGPEPRN